MIVTCSPCVEGGEIRAAGKQCFSEIFWSGEQRDGKVSRSRCLPDKKCFVIRMKIEVLVLLPWFGIDKRVQIVAAG